MISARLSHESIPGSGPAAASAAASGGERGFTLVEVIVVITLAAVVTGFTASLIREPLLAYNDVARRQVLVAAAEIGLERLARDVRRALPNSLRVAAGGTALEYLEVADGARYRSQPDTGLMHPAPADVFELGAETSFNVLGRFGALMFAYGVPLPAGTRIAVYPTGASVWIDAATGASPGAITPAGTSITVVDDGDEDQIVLAAAHQFALASPRHRMFVVSGPVSYLCAAGTLTRYWGYTVQAAQPTNAVLLPLAGAPSARLAEPVSACTFDYQPGTPQRGGLLTATLELADGSERVRLMHQIHVENVP
jgi:MSHA biogenesis protein MshO